jgi:hypothetical protein
VPAVLHDAKYAGLFEGGELSTLSPSADAHQVFDFEIRYCDCIAVTNAATPIEVES